MDPTSPQEKRSHSKTKKRVKIEDPLAILPDECSKEIEPIQAEKRMRVVRELLETERTHVSSLDIAINNYFIPLTATSILPQTTIKAIFSNLEVIRNWNQTFLAFLEAEVECGETLGSVFLQMIPFMRQLYTQYNENYENAIDAYDKAKKNKAFAQFLEKTQKETNEQKDLLTYLYLPVQRILAYDSLLKDILNLTPVFHADYKHLSNSLSALRDIQFSAILRAEQRKNINKVLYIQNNMSDDINLALPHRRYVYEGEVLLVHSRGSKERYCYLFNDLFVCCKAKRKKLDIDWKEPLETIVVEGVTDDEGFRYLFRLTSSANEYLLSSPDKHTWITWINSCKKELKIRSDKEREKSTLRNELEESSRECLINNILSWSKMQDAVLVHAEIKELAAALEKYKTLNGLQQNFSNHTYSPI